MIDHTPEPGPDPWVVRSTEWVRAGAGGFLQFHVSPGAFVKENQVIATNAGLLGREQEQIHSPHSGVVIGMSTMPAVSPGDPIAHIAKVPPRDIRKLEKALDLEKPESYEIRLREDLASNVHQVDVEDPS
jgi:predicted deacylase